VDITGLVENRLIRFPLRCIYTPDCSHQKRSDKTQFPKSFNIDPKIDVPPVMQMQRLRNRSVKTH